MNNPLRMATCVAVALALTMFAMPGFADPPNEYIPKFVQKPMVELHLGGTVANEIYYGHDEFSTAYKTGTGVDPIYSGRFMADDFADKVERAVAHVQWWGSYMSPMTTPHKQVKQFLICFESDIPDPTPDDPDTYSMPGDILSSQIVKLDSAGAIPSPGTFTETFVHPGGPPANEALFMYNAELEIPFDQKKDEIYWLKIVALVDQTDPDQQGIEWGWHNRNYTIEDPYASRPPEVVPGEHIQGTITDSTGNDIPVWHFQDDAVTGNVWVGMQTDPATGEVIIAVDQATENETYYLPGYDMPTSVEPRSLSKDLAFALYAVPEPSAAVLMGMGAICLFCRRRRR